MEVLNTTERDNSMFYGSIFATGTGTVRGDKAGVIIKPDIVAPGTKIISCSNRYVEVKYKKNNFAYEEKSGTSMSAPIISGILFGILLNFPDIKYEDAKRKLLFATTDTGYAKNIQGNGFINCKKILK